MPNPNWNDVRWNWGVANESAARLYQVADELEYLSTQRHIRSTSALEWSAGPYRDTFQAGLTNKMHTNQRLADACRTLANRINSLSEQAREEQSRREHERDRWRQEQREKARERAGNTSVH
ncbi:MAG: hypothetical protein AAGF95_32600 [Chloroflexota bacterium]